MTLDVYLMASNDQSGIQYLVIIRLECHGLRRSQQVLGQVLHEEWATQSTLLRSNEQPNS
jgi:hypothetical protein